MVKTGYIKLDFQKNSVHDIIQYSVEPFHKQLQEKQIRLEVDLPKDKNKLYIYSDIEKTVWVLMNLIGNALRYSNRWGKIVVRVIKKEKEKLSEFLVEDFGKGIEPEKLEKIFFSSISSQKNEYSPGTGLALPISREIIEAQGGKLAARSKQGEGSIFYFTLPLQA